MQHGYKPFFAPEYYTELDENDFGKLNKELKEPSKDNIKKILNLAKTGAFMYGLPYKKGKHICLLDTKHRAATYRSNGAISEKPTIVMVLVPSNAALKTAHRALIGDYFITHKDELLIITPQIKKLLEDNNYSCNIACYHTIKP